MEVYGVVLVIIGVVIYLIGSIQFIIAECSESVWWFIGSFFIPILPLIFLCVHFHEAWPSMKTILLGFLLIVIGAFMCSDKDVSWSQRFSQREMVFNEFNEMSEWSRGCFILRVKS